MEHFERKKERCVTLETDLAASLIILANKDYSETQVAEKLVELGGLGYDIGHGEYLEESQKFIRRMERYKLTRKTGFKTYRSLNIKGVYFIERLVINSFSQNSEALQVFAEELGFSLGTLVKKYEGIGLLQSA